MPAALRYDAVRRMAAPADAVLLVLLLSLALGCGDRISIHAEPLSTATADSFVAGAAVTIDCGAVSPGFELGCGKRSVDANEPIALGASVLDGPHARIEAPALACEPKASSLGAALGATLEAWCAPPLNPSEPFESTVHLRSTTATVCSLEGRAFAHTTPKWTGRLLVPKGRFRIAVRASTDSMVGCSVRLGAETSDPLTLGRSRVALGFAEGPQSMAVEFACSGVLVGAACEGSFGEPTFGSASIDLTFTASPSE